MNKLIVLALAAVLMSASLYIARAQEADNGVSSEMEVALQFGHHYFNTLESEGIEDFVATDWVLHDAQAGDRSGIEGFLEWGKSYHTVLSDFSLEIDDLVANGDRIAMRWTFTGTHTEDESGISPSRQAVTLSGMAFHLFKDGKFHETWLYYDNLSLLTQLDGLSASTAAPTPIVSKGDFSIP